MNALSAMPEKRAFTLIELMVVVAIIGLLIGVLLPAFNTVRTQARFTQAKAQFGAIDTGLQQYRGEEALGGALPPSASDNPDDLQLIGNPQQNRLGGGDTVRIAGAHLLVQALMGADRLGPPGFRDLDRSGFWWDDTDDNQGGLYEIDQNTGQEVVYRHGAGGFVDEKLAQSAKSLADLVDDGVMAHLDCDNPPNNIACNELLFVDPWDMPILYYKANGYNVRITSVVGGAPGIYRQEDNGIITGTEEGQYANDGLDFGAGKVDGRHHDLFHNESPDPTDDMDLICVQEHFEFACFIHDPSVRARPTPVNKESYLLISAGPDARYGTEDDVTNWQREAR